MFSRIAVLSSAAVICLGLSDICVAQDQHVTWVGAGASVAADSASPTALHGRLEAGTLHLDSAGRFLWLVDARLAGEYGTLGGAGNGGGELAARAAVGYTSLADSARGCGFFALAGAEGSGEFHYPRPASGDRVAGGPVAWAGLQCNLLRNLTLMAGPVATVAWGPDSFGGSQAGTDIGGEIWLSADRDFLARARVMGTVAGRESGGTAVRASLGGFYRYKLFYAGGEIETGQVSSDILSPDRAVTVSGQTSGIPFAQVNTVVGVGF